MNRTGQSAIEYLMTYGWMLLVVAIVSGAVFSLAQGQNIESVQGFDSNEITANEFGTTPSSLQMNLEAFSANGIELKGVKLRDERSDKIIDIPLDKDIASGDNAVLNLPQVREVDESQELGVELVYSVGGLENITATGTVVGNIGIDDSLIGYWTLDEDQANQTNILDISGNKLHGTPMDGMNFVEDEEKGNVIEINDTGIYFDYPALYSENIGDEITVTGWVKSLNVEEKTTTRRLSATNNDWRPAYGFGIRQTQVPNEIYTAVPEDDGFSDVRYEMEGEKWYHVTYVNKHEEMTNYLYINGELIDSVEYDRFDRNSEPLVIGSTTSEMRSLEQRQRELQIYDRALSEAEIKAIYRNKGIIQ